MIGGGYIGGEQKVCEQRTVPQMKTSQGDKHLTLIGLTLLSGELLTCVVIFSGKRCNTMVEMGIEPFANNMECIRQRLYYKEQWKEQTIPSWSYVYLPRD